MLWLLSFASTTARQMSRSLRAFLSAEVTGESLLDQRARSIRVGTASAQPDWNVHSCGLVPMSESIAVPASERNNRWCLSLPDCRLSLRERTFFRGAKGDKLRHYPTI